MLEDVSAEDEELSMGSVSLPAYDTENGTVSQILEYDCGNGVTNDGSKSYYVMVNGTDAEEFAAYCAALEKIYGAPVFRNETAGVGN
jgi:hypothetical protein